MPSVSPRAAGDTAIPSLSPVSTPVRENLRTALRAAGVEQVLRLLACAAVVAASAAGGAVGDRLRSAPVRAVRRSARRERALARIVATLGALKGVFAKAGQFAAVRHDLLPQAVTAALGSMRDRVPPLAFSSVRRTLEREFGAPLESLYDEFDPVPLGAASLAQVHRARLPSGQPVAVKVQYPWLRASLPADLALVRALLRLSSRRARAVDTDRLLDEFGAGVAGELDFRQEARIAEEIAANLAGDPRVVVPAPIHSHTTSRVLTMTWHPAIPISDRERLARAGVDRRAVLATIARAYAKQVFVDGLFHADPHPGNLLVIDDADAATSPRVLFIDFGLSRRLGPVLRRELRLALYALIQRDVDAFVDGMERLGMIAPDARPGVQRASADMFDQIAAAGGALGTAGDRVLALKTRAKRLLQETAGLQLPADLLLYAKTLGYVFALGADLAPEEDVMKLSLPYVLEFLATPEPDAAEGLSPS